MNGTKLKVAGGVFAGTLLTGGLAFAAVPAQDGTITACRHILSNGSVTGHQRSDFTADRLDMSTTTVLAMGGVVVPGDVSSGRVEVQCNTLFTSPAAVGGMLVLVQVDRFF